MRCGIRANRRKIGPRRCALPRSSAHCRGAAHWDEPSQQASLNTQATSDTERRRESLQGDSRLRHPPGHCDRARALLPEGRGTGTRGTCAGAPTGACAAPGQDGRLSSFCAPPAPKVAGDDVDRPPRPRQWQAAYSQVAIASSQQQSTSTMILSPANEHSRAPEPMKTRNSSSVG